MRIYRPIEQKLFGQFAGCVFHVANSVVDVALAIDQLLADVASPLMTPIATMDRLVVGVGCERAIGLTTKVRLIKAANASPCPGWLRGLTRYRFDIRLA
jgi:hypothetical protein